MNDRKNPFSIDDKLRAKAMGFGGNFNSGAGEATIRSKSYRLGADSSAYGLDDIKRIVEFARMSTQTTPRDIAIQKVLAKVRDEAGQKTLAITEEPKPNKLKEMFSKAISFLKKAFGNKDKVESSDEAILQTSSDMNASNLDETQDLENMASQVETKPDIKIYESGEKVTEDITISK